MRRAAGLISNRWLDYLLSVMRDEDNPVHIRLEAAKAAAHYVHPKLVAITPTKPAHEGQARIVIVPAKELAGASLSAGRTLEYRKAERPLS